MDIKELLVKFHQAIEREKSTLNSALIMYGENSYKLGQGCDATAEAREKVSEATERVKTLESAVAEVERMERTVWAQGLNGG